MITVKVAMVSAALCVPGFAAVRSGKASAEWLAASWTYQAGKPVQTAIRLVVDEGWHTYWENPGEGGMKISVKWELPEGWKAGELEHPSPIRFMTGELAGFGYEGTVVFPVKFTPPPDAADSVTLKGKISWLTCNDRSCVPGSAELMLDLVLGSAGISHDDKVIGDALKRIPHPQEGLFLEVVESAKSLTLKVKGKPPFNPADYEVFPATFQAVDPTAKFEFAPEGDYWKAVVTESEYATEPIKELALVFSGKNRQPPILLRWLAEKSH